MSGQWEIGAKGAPFGNYQLEIYNAGLAGKLPELLLTFAELEQQSQAKLSPGAYDYVAGGAGAEETMRANSEAFRKWRIVPRMLRDVASRDLRARSEEHTSELQSLRHLVCRP